MTDTPRHYDVTIDMGPEHRWVSTYAATSPAQARAAAWRALSEPFPMTFREFLNVCKSVRRRLDPSSDGYAAVERQYGKRFRVGDRVRLNEGEGEFAGQEGVLVYPGRSTCYAHVWIDGRDHPVVVHAYGVDVIETPPAPARDPSGQRPAAERGGRAGERAGAVAGADAPAHYEN